MPEAYDTITPFAYRSDNYVDLREANLQSMNLENAKLIHANLENAILRNTSFDGADLSGAYIRTADFEGASFRDAILHRVDLEYAHLQGVAFTRADLSYATLYHADLKGAFLVGAKYNKATSWPDEFNPEGIGMIEVE